jgi:hypothetical protein
MSFGQIRSLDQHLQQCERCGQWRHVTQFRDFALWCRPCEAEDALDRTLKEEDQQDIDAANDVINIIMKGKKTFDIGQSHQVKERLEALARDERIMLWANIIFDGKRPGFISRKGWRIVQQRGANKSYDDIAAEEDLFRPDVLKLEAVTMQQVVSYAAKIVDERRAEIHIPPDHPRYDFLMKGLDALAEDSPDEIVDGDWGAVGDEGRPVAVDPGAADPPVIGGGILRMLAEELGEDGGVEPIGI